MKKRFEMRFYNC